MFSAVVIYVRMYTDVYNFDCDLCAMKCIQGREHEGFDPLPRQNAAPISTNRFVIYD